MSTLLINAGNIRRMKSVKIDGTRITSAEKSVDLMAVDLKGFVVLVWMSPVYVCCMGSDAKN